MKNNYKVVRRYYGEPATKPKQNKGFLSMCFVCVFVAGGVLSTISNKAPLDYSHIIKDQKAQQAFAMRAELADQRVVYQRVVAIR